MKLACLPGQGGVQERQAGRWKVLGKGLLHSEQVMAGDETIDKDEIRGVVFQSVRCSYTIINTLEYKEPADRNIKDTLINDDFFFFFFVNGIFLHAK